ncbi:MAG TPA: DUF4129 domain-containing protein, partial [Candidatus Acidoferrales bacterium]|nr:DUF4129 domain-containing protein [Candidatus Acidoferrales bacterium]
MIARAATIMFLVAALAVPTVWTNASQVGDSASLDQALNHVADQLDGVAATLRHHRHRAVTVPSEQLAPTHVGNADTSQLSLDHWLQSQLKKIRSEKSTTKQSTELGELAASLRRAARPGLGYRPALDPGRLTVAVLAQRAYQTGGTGPAPAPHPSLIEIVLGWLGNQIGKLFERIFGATASRPYIGRIFAILFIAVLAVLLAYLIYVLVLMIARRRRPSLADVGAPLQEHAEPDALYAFSADAASRGEYARAVSLLFQASLASFDRAGKLPYDGSLTAGEYRRAVQRTVSGASPYFDDIAHVFVLAAFAERPVSKDDFTVADVAYRALHPLLAS